MRIELVNGCGAGVLCRPVWQDLSLPNPGETSYWSVHDSFRAGRAGFLLQAILSTEP